MLITRNTDYALRALKYIAESGSEKTTVNELVKELKIPRAFLRKILQLLGKNGVLISFKGLKGGFRLSKPPEAIYLTDILNILQKGIKLNECIFKGKICPDKNRCLLKEKLDSIEMYANLVLKDITLRSLMKEG